MRALILSWEYPPLIEGGLARHVRKLAENLAAQDVDVHVLARGRTGRERLESVERELTFQPANLADGLALSRAVQRVQPHVIYHLAVQREVASPAGRAAALSTNVIGTANLLEAAWAAGSPRVICLGSSLEYGQRDEAARESDPLAPSSFYGATKAAATLMVRQAFLAERRPVVVLRPYLLYGPWDAPHHLIPTAIRVALGKAGDRSDSPVGDHPACGGGLPLTLPGLRRDWVFVQDVVDACLRAAFAERALGEGINVGTGTQWSNEEVVEAVAAVTDRRIDTRPGVFPSRPTDCGCWVADVTKARELLGWEPRHTLRDGLQKTYEWIVSRQGRATALEAPREPM